MPRNNTPTAIIRRSFLYLATAIGLFAINKLAMEWLSVKNEQVVAGLMFLTGVYLLLFYLFAFSQKRHPNKSGFTFLILMALKLCFIFAYLFLFLNPAVEENKKEILLFLMNYFAFLIIDLIIKTRLTELET